MADYFPPPATMELEAKRKAWLTHSSHCSLVNLGILYKDDAAKKRGVLKSHDQQTLEKN
jgi:hypothetical protein